MDLGGGRDSRVVAAAFLSAGVDLRLNSYDAVPGELQVAESLVRALPRTVEHVVSRKPPGGTVRPQPVKPQPLELVERARRWHRYAEGLRPASYLFHAPPKNLTAVDHLVIGGAGGEVAHGHFYPADMYCSSTNSAATGTACLRQPPANPADADRGRLAEPARAAVGEQIERVLLTAVHGGIQNATMLDYFYVVERLRRWVRRGSGAESCRHC